MNHQKKNIMTLCAAAVGCAGLAFLNAEAHAGVISFSDLPTGTNSVSIGGLASGNITANVVSFDANFQPKTVAGVTAVGVQGGSVNGEIDGSQYIEFNFSAPVFVDSISIAHLYTAGNFGDVWNETALFSTDIGDFTLEATGATSGAWTGGGTLVNDSPAVEKNGGAWSVIGGDIFDGAITSIRLQSGNAGNHSKYGDFGFVGMEVSAIPGPGALALFAGAMLAGFKRRRSGQ